MSGGMDQFDNNINGGSNNNNNLSMSSMIESSQTLPTGAAMSGVPLAYSNVTPYMYKPLIPGSSSPSPPPPPPAVCQSVGDDSTLPQPNISVPVSAEQTKRKRGRPRKNSIDGSGSTSSPSVKQSAQPAGMGSGGTPSSSTGKKRGRPPGSGRKNLQAFGGSSSSSIAGRGTGFTAQIIIVEAGEDIAAKILSVAESGLQVLCIITANGSVSNVTIRQNPSSPNGTVSYEGRFEIVTLSGSYIVSEIGGERNTSGGLSTLLAGSDGHVLGGCIAGLLIAASQVQIVVGCFVPCKEYPWKQPAKQQSVAVGGGSSTSRGTMSECSGGGLVSPPNQTSGGGGGGEIPTIPAWHHDYENREQDQQHRW